MEGGGKAITYGSMPRNDEIGKMVREISVVQRIRLRYRIMFIQFEPKKIRTKMGEREGGKMLTSKLTSRRLRLPGVNRRPGYLYRSKRGRIAN